MSFKLSNVLLVLLFLSCFLADADAQNPPPDLRWHDARELTVEGKGWAETKGFYDRLPAKAEGVVRPPVWNLAQNSSGVSVRFTTDAAEIRARWKLKNQGLSLPNMVSAAHSGIDLYVKENGGWRWAANARPDKFPASEAKLIGNMARKTREWMLYLPLYNGVEAIEIGLPENAAIAKAAPFPAATKPIVFYGTSIVQGASASRPGISYPAILSRRLARPIVNLGFSGNCKMEPELGALLAELDPSVYFIDCLPNLSSGEEVTEKTPPLIQKLRRARPNVPIVLVENIIYPDTFLEEKKRAIVDAKNRALEKVYLELKKSGVKNLHYVPARGLLGADNEGTIDGVHPTDVGFERMANAFEPVLRKLLPRAR
ncbi:MAG TPA: SGNH/GDSL hydrolase family protein [Pyrinomonadaceae bacterium]